MGGFKVQRHRSPTMNVPRYGLVSLTAGHYPGQHTSVKPINDAAARRATTVTPYLMSP